MTVYTEEGPFTGANITDHIDFPKSALREKLIQVLDEKLHGKWARSTCCTYHENKRASAWEREHNEKERSPFEIFSGLVELACLEVEKHKLHSAHYNNYKGKEQKISKSGYIEVYRFIKITDFVSSFFPKGTPPSL